MIKTEDWGRASEEPARGNTKANIEDAGSRT